MAGIPELVISPKFLTYTILLFGGFLIIFTVLLIFSTLRPKDFPPGPRGHPIVGNLLQIDRAFSFLSFGTWGKEYGIDTPLGLKFGANNLVVLNSARLVHEIFEKRGAVYSDRPTQASNWIFKELAIMKNSGAWLTRWRKKCTDHFGAVAVTRYRQVYEAEAARLLVKLLEGPTASREELEAVLVCWLMSAICLGVCGKRPDYMGNLGFEIKQFRHCGKELEALFGPSLKKSFPILRYISAVFGGGTEWGKRGALVREEILKMGSQFLIAAKEQREALDAGKPIKWESLVTKMLTEKREKDDDNYMFTEQDIGLTAFNIIDAAITTSLAVFSIMLLIMAKYPELQQRVRNEILEVSGGAPPKASDISSWKYTEAFWNELHRMYPVSTHPAPHAPNKDDVYNGHRIPKGTAVFINSWHIHHTEEDYDEPDKFIPERFLRHPLGMRPDKAHDPAHMENIRATYNFGAGRRICPGIHIAKQNFLLGVAKVLWAFDILVPEGKEVDLSLRTGFVQGIVLVPKELNVVLKLRDGCSKEDIIDHYSQAYEAEAEVMGWEDGLYKW